MRLGEAVRNTEETKISVKVNLDGTGKSNISTGIGFFDHMLKSFTKHGFFDIDIKADGDLEVDSHHTMEDTGIVLGMAFKDAIGDKKGIKRFGDAVIPMDDALVLCAVDISGRPYLGYELDFTVDKIGEADTEMFKEFFYAFSYAAGINIHVKQISGKNNHHICESAFKAFAKAMDTATLIDERIDGVLSTKGNL